MGYLIAPSVSLIAAWMAVILLFPAKGIPATCNATGWTDRNGDSPVAEDGGKLECYLDSSDDHFRIYFNRCADSGCVDEQINEINVEPMGDFLECAWQLFLGAQMSQPGLVFDDPRPSQWLKHPVIPSTGVDEYIPVLINKESGAGGGSWRPALNFPASGRLHNSVTPNAIHEFAHILGFSCSGYAIPHAPFANEGLPTFYERVFREPNSRRYGPICWDNNVFLDLSAESLRTRAYCEAARFWHFLSRFGNRDGLPEFYESGELVPACADYSNALDAVTDGTGGPQIYPTGGRMRRIPGRDVIKAFYDRVAACFPNHRSTTVCTENSGFYAKCSYPRYPMLGTQVACQPDDGYLNDLIAEELYAMTYANATTSGTAAEIDARKKAIAERRRGSRGVVMMPLLLDAVDHAALSVWPQNTPADPRASDGVGFFMFRRFLEWNYGQREQPAGTFVINSIDCDAEGFVIKAFGAHYHQFDITHDRALISLRKDDDLSEWAYAAFYIDEHPGGRTLVPVSDQTGSSHSITSGWQQDNSARIDIPMHPDFDKAVIIVTALKATFDTATIAEVGHYQLQRLPPMIRAPGSGLQWRKLPWIPWPYGPWPWYGNVPPRWGVDWPPRPWPGAEIYGDLPHGVESWYGYDSPWGFGDLDWPGYAAYPAGEYGYAGTLRENWGDRAYRPYGFGGWPGYVSPWGYGDFGWSRPPAWNYHEW